MRNSMLARRAFVSMICVIASTYAFANPVLHFSGAGGRTLDIADYTYTVPKSPDFALNLSFAKADAMHLWSLMRASRGRRVEIRIGSVETLTPIVRDAPSGSDLQLTMSNAAELKAVQQALDEGK